MHHIPYSHFGISQRKENVEENCKEEKIYGTVLYLSKKKNPHLGGPVQFKPMSLKGHLYYVSKSNLEFVNAVR